MGILDMCSFYFIFPFHLLFLFDEWKSVLEPVLSSPSGHKSHEGSLGKEITFQIGKRTRNPNEPMHICVRMST